MYVRVLHQFFTPTNVVLVCRGFLFQLVNLFRKADFFKPCLDGTITTVMLAIFFSIQLFFNPRVAITIVTTVQALYGTL